MDYQRFLSSKAPKGTISVHTTIKNIIVYGKPLAYDLSFGMPNPLTFPFHKASVVLKDGTKFELDPEVIRTALQYNKTNGYPPLVEHIKALIQHLHNPPKWSERELLITNGSLEGLSRVFEILLDGGDSLIIPGPCYHGVFVASKHLQPNYLTVETDAEGLIPESLQDAILSTKHSGRSPKVLYINPCGNNPTGSVLPESRKRLIYDLACKHDLLIIEDDPYCYLKFSDETAASFLQLDTENRVIRLESFSKILSAGMRLGFVLGPKHIISILGNLSSASVIHTSMMPQVMVSGLFDTWGINGFLKKTKMTRDFYKRQRDLMAEAAEKHLKGLCEWTLPSGGFFFWFKIPKVQDTKNLLLECGIKKGVIFVPGSFFFPDFNIPSQYLRASYATTNREELDKGFKVLADAIREEVTNQKLLKI